MASQHSTLRICSAAPDLGQIRNFVLAILNSPQLAAQVTRLKYDTYSWRPWMASSLPYTIENEADEHAERAFKSAIEAQKWPEDEGAELLKRLMVIKWEGFNEPTSIHMNPDAVVALILPILPNLETWDVGDIQTSGSRRFVHQALMRNQQHQYGTKAVAVQHVKIIPNHRYSDASYYDYPFDNFATFALLPHLKRISGKGVGGVHVEDAGSYLEIPPQASDVEEIELMDCELGSSCVSKIIGFSRGLKKFTYRTGGRALLDGGSTVVYGFQLRKALEAHRTSLKELDLEIDIRFFVGHRPWEENDEHEDEENEEDGTNDEKVSLDIAEDFPVFPHLTHLRIGYKMLMGLVMSSPRGTEKLIDWLPSTLEELTIIGYNSKEILFKSWIKEVLEKKDEHFPKLTIKGIDEVIENKEDLDSEDDYQGEVSEDGSQDKDSDETDDESDNESDESKEVIVVEKSRSEAAVEISTMAEGHGEKEPQEDQRETSKRRRLE